MAPHPPHCRTLLGIPLQFVSFGSGPYVEDEQEGRVCDPMGLVLSQEGAKNQCPLCTQVCLLCPLPSRTGMKLTSYGTQCGLHPTPPQSVELYGSPEAFDH